MTQQIEPLLNIQKRFFYCHPHAKPPYPTLPGVYIYSLGVKESTEARGDAHAQKSNSRPYGINRSVINIELKAVHPDHTTARRLGANEKT